MPDIYEKFKKLPLEIQRKLNSREVLISIDEIDKEFPQEEVSLAEIVIAVAVGDISRSNLSSVLEEQYKIEKTKSSQIAAALEEKIFNPIFGPWEKENKLEEKMEEEKMIEEPKKEKEQEEAVEGKEKINELLAIKTKEEIEEEKEIEKIKEKTDEKSFEKFNFDEALEKIIQKNNLSFSEERFKKRFSQIIFSFLKGIRGEIETKETLNKSEKIGGMNYSLDLSDNIINDLKKMMPLIEMEEKKEEIKESPIKAEPSLPLEPLSSKKALLIKKSSLPPSVIADKQPKIMPEEKIQEAFKEISSIKKEQKEPPKSPEIEIVETQISEKEMAGFQTPKSEIIEPKAPEVPSSAPLEQITSSKTAPELTASEPVVSESVTPISSFTMAPVLSFSRPPSPEKEKAGEEIKVTPKIYGPIDELRALKLFDWRRWGGPEEATSRILEKINMLTEESLSRGAEGKKAWRESEVYRLYLEIGAEAMDQGVDIKNVIKKRQEAGEPVLTEEEFEAIGRLNEHLRY